MYRQVLVVILAAILPATTRAADSGVNYTGHYELVDKHAERVFSLDLNQNGSRVQVNFCAADPGDATAKPTGEGQGRVNNRGILEFTFKDNFANEGTATLAPANNNYRVEMRITKFVDSAPLHFYGDILLKKTADNAQKVACTGLPIH